MCACEQLFISTPSIFLGVIPCLPGVFLTLRDSDTHSKLPLLYFLLHTSLPLFYLEGDVCTECRGFLFSSVETSLEGSVEILDFSNGNLATHTFSSSANCCLSIEDELFLLVRLFVWSWLDSIRASSFTSKPHLHDLAACHSKGGSRG